MSNQGLRMNQDDKQSSFLVSFLNAGTDPSPLLSMSGGDPSGETTSVSSSQIFRDSINLENVMATNDPISFEESLDVLNDFDEVFESENEAFISKCEAKRFEACTIAMKSAVDKIGFDPIEKEHRLREQEKLMLGVKADRYKVSRPDFLPPKKVSLRSDLRPRNPPVRPQRELDDEQKNVPELIEGEIVDDDDAAATTAAMQDNDIDLANGFDNHVHTTRCIDCSKLLKVKKMTSLVFCPQCRTISPNSWTQ